MSVDDVVITASFAVAKSSAVMFSGTKLGSFSRIFQQKNKKDLHILVNLFFLFAEVVFSCIYSKGIVNPIVSKREIGKPEKS